MKIKCMDSFMYGAYLTFVVMMLISGWVISKEFVSKTSLKSQYVTIDGEFYKVQKI